SPAQVEPVVRLIMEEISSLKKTGVTREELNRAKEQIRGNLLLGMENTANRMMRLGKTETCYGRVITVEEALARLAEVTEDRVRALAERLFRPEAFALTAIGPLKRGIAL
ncbi:MAG: insulinase family protein, partial [Clostridia bacterium]|nr:insulinase family protein [Clostridia bacterium]